MEQSFFTYVQSGSGDSYSSLLGKREGNVQANILHPVKKEKLVEPEKSSGIKQEYVEKKKERKKKTKPDKKRSVEKRSPFRGVTWNKKNQKWRADIRICGHLKFLGLFLNEKEAARAYDEAAIRMLGSKQGKERLNFPEEFKQRFDSLDHKCKVEHNDTPLPPRSMQSLSSIEDSKTLDYVSAQSRTKSYDTSTSVNADTKACTANTETKTDPQTNKSEQQTDSDQFLLQLLEEPLSCITQSDHHMSPTNEECSTVHLTVPSFLQSSTQPVDHPTHATVSSLSTLSTLEPQTIQSIPTMLPPQVVQSQQAAFATQTSLPSDGFDSIRDKVVQMQRDLQEMLHQNQVLRNTVNTLIQKDAHYSTPKQMNLQYPLVTPQPNPYPYHVNLQQTSPHYAYNPPSQ